MIIGYKKMHPNFNGSTFNSGNLLGLIRHGFLIRAHSEKAFKNGGFWMWLRVTPLADE